MTQALLQQAIDAIRHGDKAGGQRLLAQVLRADPRSETAWLWMSQIVETDAQRLDCLRRILAINPNNAAARRGVEMLEARPGAASSPAPPHSEAPPAPTRLAPRSAPIQPEPPLEPALPTLPLVETSRAAEAMPAEAAPVEAAPFEAPPPAEQPPAAKAAKPAPPATPKRERRPARRRSLILILLILVVALGGGGLLAIVASRPGQPTAAPVEAAGRLAVVRLDRDGLAGIVLIKPDGSGLTQLASTLAVNRINADTNLAWSPDGSRIAFMIDASGAVEIAVIDANGQGFTQLTRDAVNSIDPAWSPDGARIAFASHREGDLDIFVMGADGTGQFNLTRFEGNDRAPTWAPDGKSLVFQSDREGQIDIYRMNPDGSGVARLTDDPADDFAPAVSPGGDLIAFVSTRDGDADIFVMDVDGSSPRAVADNPVDDQAPSWTPNGSILFTSIVTGSAAPEASGATQKAPFFVNPDGSELARVGGDAGNVARAAWQPVDVDPATLTARAVLTPTIAAAPFELPSGAIAFASNRAGNFDLYRMDVDGANLSPLVAGPLDERYPSFSSIAARIAYEAPVSLTQHIFITDGISILTLTQATASARRPAWSPDGTRLAYQIDGERGPDLIVVNADGSGAARLTDRPGVDGCFSWRLDGKQIAFTSDRGGSWDIFVMSVDEPGRGVTRLTQHAADELCPAWRPDGEAIAFISDWNGEGVYLMNADGANARLIAAIQTRRAAGQPAWSADGKFLLVSSDQDGDGDVYLIAIDSAAVLNLTADSGADEVDPIWLP